MWKLPLRSPYHGKKNLKPVTNLFRIIVILIITNNIITKNRASELWSSDKIIRFMMENPNRASFSRLFLLGGFRTGMEVGVADGRFTEHFLKDLKSISGLDWTMIEPFPNQYFLDRYSPVTTDGTWKNSGLLDGVKLRFYKKLSLDSKLLEQLPNNFYDFIYLDGDHSYMGVKQEIPLYWSKLKRGGVLAGHDYCNYGETNLGCNGCQDVPLCQFYTEYGILHGKGNVQVDNQNGVVQAVQEWLMGTDDNRLVLYHTYENFTRDSLSSDRMDYDLVITSTRNPSWFIIKPL